MKREFKLQSYLHAISRAIWAEQAASTETQGLSKALHDILQVLVQVPEPFCWMQLCLFMEDVLAGSSIEASPRQRWSAFFFSPGHNILPEALWVYKWSSWKARPHVFWWILTPPDSSRNVLLPCSHSSSIYLKKIVFNILFHWLKEKMLQ